VNRSRDNNRGRAYEEWVAERAAEVAEEQRLQAAAESQDPVQAFQKSANALAESTRTALISNSNLFPNIERIAGRAVNEEVAAQNYKWWAENTGKTLGFEKHHSRAVLDCWRRNDLVPSADAFTAVFQSLKDYGLLPDAEPGSPDWSGTDSEFSKLGFGKPVRDIEASPEQISRDFDEFITTTGWRKSATNAKKLISELQRLDLVPVLKNLKMVVAYLKSRNEFLEPTEMTPSEQAAQRRHDYLFKLVATDPRDPSKKYSESDLDKLPAEEARYIRRYAERGHSGNNLLDDFYEIKNLQAVRDARIAAEGEQQ